VEFAFVEGRLYLLQIRPFNESARARGHAFLQALDRAQAGRLAGTAVPMTEPPRP
jgi:hypothetical protein